MKVSRNPKTDAERILRLAWQGSADEPRLPIDPGFIAKALGIAVYEAELGPGTSAVIAKERGQDAVIVLNSGDSPNRQRFSCAHEIGHWVLHAGAEDFEYIDRRDDLAATGLDPVEVYANNFAACLLMPEQQVREWARKGVPLYEMAVAFGVSPEAMQNRLNNLGLNAA